MFNLAEMKRVDDRICRIKERIREDSIGSLESAFQWLPEYWWSDDQYAKLFEAVLAYQVIRKNSESKEFKPKWIPSVLRKFYPDFLYEQENIPLTVSLTAISHCITVEGKYRISFDPREITKYPSPTVIIPIRFVNYIYKSSRESSRLVFGFNDNESKCFIIKAPLTLIKKHDIEVLDREVKPYFGFSTK